MIYYIIFNIIGMLSALIVSKKMREGIKRDLTSEQKLKNMAGLITGAIIGSKMPVILSYGFNIAVILSSKSIYGALIGAYIGINISKYISGLKGNFGDLYILPLCIGIFFGKIGCYFYGCCGSENYPVQIWTAGFHLALFFFFYFIHNHKYLIGGHFALYMILYSSYRFCIEFLRTEPRVLLDFTIYQLMAIIFLPYFAYVLNNRVFKKEVYS